MARSNFDTGILNVPDYSQRPQPAPRLSKVNTMPTESPIDNMYEYPLNSPPPPPPITINDTSPTNNFTAEELYTDGFNIDPSNPTLVPPPLPPKPKILPIKPSNWGQGSPQSKGVSPTSPLANSLLCGAGTAPTDIVHRQRKIYLDQSSSSSFV